MVRCLFNGQDTLLKYHKIGKGKKCTDLVDTCTQYVWSLSVGEHLVNFKCQIH